MKIFAAMSLAALVPLSGCFIDFTEAIPCREDAQCPTGFACDTINQQCVASQDPLEAPEPEPAPEGNPAPNNDPGLDAGGDPDIGPVEDVDEGPVADVDEGEGDGPCPPGMAHVDDTPGVEPFCLDRFEASRSNASATSQGSGAGRATSRGNVLPWTNLDPAAATAACAAADKRLCTPQEWTAGCGGPEGRNYPYHPTQYVVGMCNTTGSLQPTGSRPDCVFADYQTFDMSGNVIEIVDAGQGGLALLGGSFGNTSAVQLTCKGPVINTAAITQIGFRCCKSLP